MSSIIDFYRSELNRIAWRLQYKVRVQNRREIPLYEEFILRGDSFTDGVDNQVLVENLINSIQSRTGQKIIYELFINDKTEIQIAREMDISQQAVSKWKKKILLGMYQKMSS